jgi:hypothetical protein
MSNPLDAALEAIADGRDVDWRSLDRAAGGGDELKWLRVIAEIADQQRERPSPAEAETVGVGDGTGRAAPAAAIGVWGRYQLVAEIGRGAYGSVYRAFDPGLQIEIAIKILHNQVADAGLRRQVLREGRALAQIQQQNVVRVLGVESHGDRVGLCMEFVAGDTLDSIVRTQGVFNDREATLIGQDLCRALVAVHNAGFIHRDIKARNVMRQRAGRIVLMDFGTGFKVDSPASSAFDVVGTPRYMAPEVLAGERPTPRSDVYSLGVLLYYLVSGEYPVDGGTLDELLRAHAAGRRRSLSDRRSDVSPDFARVVAQATAADPQKRFQSAGELLDALQFTDKRRHPLRIVLDSALAAAAIAAGWLVLGVMNSVPFNQSLGRTEFASEGVWDWLQWGAKSTLGPSVLLTLGLMAAGLGVSLARLAAGVSPAVRRAGLRVEAQMHRWRLDDPAMLASLALLVSTAALAASAWAFAPLIRACFNLEPGISTAPFERLQYLSPAYYGYHENYRITFTWATVISVALWYQVLRKWRRPAGTIVTLQAAAGVAVIAGLVFLLNFPYRLLWHTEFEAVAWNGAHCYVLGERGDERLLFCPELAPPRNRVVRKDAAGLQHIAAGEHMFSRLAVSTKDGR